MRLGLPLPLPEPLPEHHLSITYSLRDIFKDLSCFLVAADFFKALPLQIPRSEELKVKPVGQ